jgi:hypothetical protein
MFAERFEVALRDGTIVSEKPVRIDEALLILEAHEDAALVPVEVTVEDEMLDAYVQHLTRLWAATGWKFGPSAEDVAEQQMAHHEARRQGTALWNDITEHSIPAQFERWASRDRKRDARHEARVERRRMSNEIMIEEVA